MGIQEGEEVFGVVHIFASFNDTFVHVTDLSGRETLVRVTGGMKVKADRDESSPYAAMLAAQDVAVRCQELGVTALHVKLRLRGGTRRRPPGRGPSLRCALLRARASRSAALRTSRPRPPTAPAGRAVAAVAACNRTLYLLCLAPPSWLRGGAVGQGWGRGGLPGAPLPHLEAQPGPSQRALWVRVLPAYGGEQLISEPAWPAPSYILS